MSHLEDAQTRWRQLRKDRAFGGCADVAQEHDGDVAISHLQDHRVVITHALALPIGRGRVQHPDPGAGNRERIACEPPLDACIRLTHLREQRLQPTVVRDRDAFPDLRWRKVVHYGWPSTDVIGIAVRKHQCVEPPQPAGPQRG